MFSCFHRLQVLRMNIDSSDRIREMGGEIWKALGVGWAFEHY